MEAGNPDAELHSPGFPVVLLLFLLFFLKKLLLLDSLVLVFLALLAQKYAINFQSQSREGGDRAF